LVVGHVGLLVCWLVKRHVPSAQLAECRTRTELLWIQVYAIYLTHKFAEERLKFQDNCSGWRVPHPDHPAFVCTTLILRASQMPAASQQAAASSSEPTSTTNSSTNQRANKEAHNKPNKQANSQQATPCPPPIATSVNQPANQPTNFNTYFVFVPLTANSFVQQPAIFVSLASKLHVRGHARAVGTTGPGCCTPSTREPMQQPNTRPPKQIMQCLLPRELAMEVGASLDRVDVLVCETQLCHGGVAFVTRPHTDSALAKVVSIRLRALIARCGTVSHWSRLMRTSSKDVAQDAVKRIEFCLSRRTRAEKLVFVADLRHDEEAYNAEVYSLIHHHFRTVTYLQRNKRQSLAIEWHASATSITDDVAFLICQAPQRPEKNGDARTINTPTPDSCQSLFTFDLSHTRVRDLSALASCQPLHKLNLRYTQVSNIDVLGSCQALHTLDLANSKVRNVSALASCQSLNILRLTNTLVADVSPLAACQSLKTLNLENTPVTDIAALALCQSLHELHLWNTQVTTLASFPSLHRLEVGGTQVSDLSPLASCPLLHTLFLNRCPVKDVSKLASCQSLHTLNLTSTQVRDVSPLAACPSLHTLDLWRTEVSDVSALARCKSLNTLKLVRTSVSDVSALAASQSLYRLDLTGTPVGDVSALAACPTLHTLTLWNSGVRDVSALATSKSLRYVIGPDDLNGIKKFRAPLALQYSGQLWEA
jgi:hypothetical protein